MKVYFQIAEHEFFYLNVCGFWNNSVNLPHHRVEWGAGENNRYFLSLSWNDNTEKAFTLALCSCWSKLRNFQCRRKEQRGAVNVLGCVHEHTHPLYFNTVIPQYEWWYWTEGRSVWIIYTHGAGLYQLLILTLTGNAKASVGRIGFGYGSCAYFVLAVS